MTVMTAPPSTTTVAMLTMADLATRWSCSLRHVTRLVDTGGAPTGVKLGRLRRFPLREIEQWERAGCPDASTRRSCAGQSDA